MLITLDQKVRYRSFSFLSQKVDINLVYINAKCLDKGLIYT